MLLRLARGKKDAAKACARMSTARGPSAASQLIDQSMLLGAIAYLKSVAVTNVGIYSTSQQWRTITGTPPTAFSSIPVWVPGYATLAAAEAACAMTSFTGGRVAMIQYPSQGLDGDYICGLVSTPGATSISVAATSGYSVQLVVSGATSAVTWVQTTGSPSLLVSSTGLVTTSGALPAGTYGATGSTSDTNGDVGLFSFLLNVGTIVQVAPTSATLKTTQTPGYSDQLVLSGNFGATTFTQTSGAPSLLVSSTGLVNSSGTLIAGTYRVKGTTSDPYGDVGTFVYTLSVSATKVAPVIVGPDAQYVVRHAVAGRTVVLQIIGVGFSGRPTVTSHEGTTALVLSDTGTVLDVRVRVDARSRNGVFTFTLTMPDGTVTRVKYNQH